MKKTKKTYNNIIDEIIANTSFYRKIKYRIMDFLYDNLNNRISQYTKRKMHCYTMKLYGYNVIAHTQAYWEDTYFFESQTEADLTFERFEKNDNVFYGWFYGLDSKYFKEVLEYINKHNIPVTVLDKKFEYIFNSLKNDI